MSAVRGLIGAAAVGIGAIVVWLAPADEVADAPFVEDGGVGDTVSLEYADVTLVRTLTADQLTADEEPVLAAGTFLVADVELVARGTSQEFGSAYVRGADGRLFGASDNAECTSSESAPNLPSGLRFFARYCFDLPRDALAGSTLVLARGEGVNQGSEWRRDGVAEFDLGIGADDVAALWDAEDAYESFEGGLEPLPESALEPSEWLDLPPLMQVTS